MTCVFEMMRTARNSMDVKLWKEMTLEAATEWSGGCSDIHDRG
jgi:hypothetical protein